MIRLGFMTLLSHHLKLMIDFNSLCLCLNILLFIFYNTLIIFSFLLTANIYVVCLGASITVWQLLKERQQQLDKWNKKIKRK